VVLNNAAASSVGRLFTGIAEHHRIATISVVRSEQRAQQRAEQREAYDGLRRQRAARPAEAHAQPGLEVAPLQLDLLADLHLRARAALGLRRGHAAQAGEDGRPGARGGARGSDGARERAREDDGDGDGPESRHRT